MSYCNICQNTLKHQVAGGQVSMVCIVCGNTQPIEKGGTLISGGQLDLATNKHEHLTRHMEYDVTVRTLDDTPCTKCRYQHVKFIMPEGVSYYKCLKCHHLFDNDAVEAAQESKQPTQ